MIEKVLETELKHAISKYEDVYGIAIILGQTCNYMGLALATEDGLRQKANQYHYEYHYYFPGKDENENLENLCSWLRWSNPDDGWLHLDFEGEEEISRYLSSFDFDDEKLWNSTIDLLKNITLHNSLGGAVVGITYGSDPNDFKNSVTEVYGEEKARIFLSEYNLMQDLENWIQKA